MLRTASVVIMLLGLSVNANLSEPVGAIEVDSAAHFTSGDTRLVTVHSPKPAKTTMAPSNFGGFAAHPAGGGFWIVSKNGCVTTGGSAQQFGDMCNSKMNASVVGIASSQTGNGYWLVGSDGGIFAFGDAGFFGSMGSSKLNKPVIGMNATNSGAGYWLFAGDGGIFAFGDAGFFGSTGGMKLNSSVVAMSATESGHGYWLVASDGGIFAFNAPFRGSMGGQPLNAPVVGALRSRNDGYWLVASDGGIFSFNANFYGSGAGSGGAEVIGMAPVDNNTDGYIIVRVDGTFNAYSENANNNADYCPRPQITEPPYSPSYEFTYLQTDGQPMRWSPCRNINWTMNTDGATAGQIAEVHDAINELKAATNLPITFVGTTSETVAQRQNYSSISQTDPWLPVLIDFVSPGDSALCGGSAIGCATMVNVSDFYGNHQLISGKVALDIRGSVTTPWTMRELVLHEFGHILGLDHTGDSSQIMYPYISSSNRNLGSGDKYGLWLLSAALNTERPFWAEIRSA